MLVDGDSVYVVAGAAAGAGIYRYDVADLPTSNDRAGGCDGKDATGAPMATNVPSTLFIEPARGNTRRHPGRHREGSRRQLYVSSVFNGVIGEFTADGKFVRKILKPPAGEQLGTEPFSTGTPLGVGVGPDGSVYYADIGIVVDDGIGPGRGTGKVRRIAFDEQGNPNPPDDDGQGLAFPDGIGIWQAPAQ